MQSKWEIMEMVKIKKYVGWKVLALLGMLAAFSFAYVFATHMPTAFHGIGVLKSADPFAAIGDTVTYQIKVYNPSNYDLYNINVTDPMLELNDTIPFMAASNTTGVTYTFHREVLETDPDSLVNTVYVEAIDSEGVHSSASTQAITVLVERLIVISKTGLEYACRGETIDYTIMVNNTGNVDLFDVVVEDEMLGFTWKGDLSEGESNVFNLTYKVPCDAEEAFTNTATVWAQLNDTTIYNEASWTTEILHPFVPHSMGYWKNHPENWPVDEIDIGNVTYTKEEALTILKEANAKDATKMLAAQLIAAKLNRISGASPWFSHNCNCANSLSIDDIIEEADTFLTNHSIGSDPRGEDREVALQLKNTLDAYNNSECD